MESTPYAFRMDGLNDGGLLIHFDPFTKIFLPSSRLIQIKEGLCPTYAFRKEPLGKYFPFITWWHKEFSQWTNRQHCLAKWAKLKASKYLNPNPLSNFRI